MDETKVTQQDPLQETGQASEGSAGSTSQTPQTYTKDQVDKAIKDALAAKGRDAKTLSEKEASLNAQQADIDAAKTQIAEFEQQRDRAELEEARRDPAKMVEYQQKRSYKQMVLDLENQKKEFKRQQDEFNRQKAEHEAAVQADREDIVKTKLRSIAWEHQVDVQQLKDTMKELNLTSLEQAEALAKRLGTQKRPAEEPNEDFEPDSGVTSGGVPSEDQRLKQRYPSMYSK